MGERALAGSPIAPLVAFSAATNLSIAGRTVRFDGPAEARLRAAVAGFGGRIVEHGPADVVFTADPDRIEVEPAPGGTVVVGLVDPPAADGAPLRPGVAQGRVAGVAIVRGLPPYAASWDDADRRLDWASLHMPASRAAAAALGDAVRGLRIGISMVLEPKTAMLALLLQSAGAEVGVFAFAAETDAAVAAALRARGIAVHAAASATPADERAHALALLDARPHVLVDDGAHVIRLAHRERPDVVAGLVGATEETTSGVTPLRSMAADGALLVPVLAANDALTKTWFDNRHGTGETCVLATVRALDDDLHGARIAVVGFGPVGEGCAERFRALGADVVVVDRDPRRALAARFAGYEVAAVEHAVAAAEVIVSATGVPGTIDAAVLAACRPDAAIVVAGGAPEEVLLPHGLRAEALAPHLVRFTDQDGSAATPPGTPSEPTRPAAGPDPCRIRVRLVAGGDCVNIVSGEGNPIDVMDLSFAVQLTAIRRLLETSLPPGVHRLSEADDRAVAALAGGSDVPAAPVPPVDWRRTRFDL